MPRRPQVDQPDLLNKVFLKNDLVKRAGKEKWRQWATIGGFQNFTDRIAEYLSENYSIEVMRNTKMEGVSVLPDNRLRLSLNSAGKLPCQFDVVLLSFAVVTLTVLFVNRLDILFSFDTFFDDCKKTKNRKLV